MTSETFWLLVGVAGFFVLRGVFATVVFLKLLPEMPNCPSCDAETLRVEPAGFQRLFARRYRASWCPRCNWHGLLNFRPRDDEPAVRRGAPPGGRPGGGGPVSPSAPSRRR